MGPTIDMSRLVYSTTIDGTSANIGYDRACTSDCTGGISTTTAGTSSITAGSLPHCTEISATSLEIKATNKLAETAQKIMSHPYYKDYKYHRYNSYIPKRIIYNDPATVVFWKDGTKTVVKRAPNEVSNHYTAFCAALAKKIFETNSHVNRIVKSGECVEKKTAVKKQEEKKPEPKKPAAKKPVTKKQPDKKKK